MTMTTSPFTFQLIPLGHGGIAPCASCARGAADAAGQTPPAPRPSEDILADINALPAAAHDVAFGGFEPFDHPELPRLIAAATERAGARRLLLQTDGGALSRGGNAEGAVLAGARVFEIFYHAGDDDADDALTGQPGLAAARQAGASALRRVAAAYPEAHLMVCGVAALCRHGGRGAALPAIAQAAARDGLDALRIEAQPGAAPDATQLAAAAEILIPAGIWLFGDGCDELPAGAAPYQLAVCQGDGCAVRQGDGSSVSSKALLARTLRHETEEPSPCLTDPCLTAHPSPCVPDSPTGRPS
ncbi:MAG: hypothetical protein FWD65_07135 [Coriobacteriia bacterium]|nr:hypothetical protein [Coriobacteriia bacterium]